MKALQRTEWFPGWHVGVLRGRGKNNDTALFLNGNEHKWTQRTGHRHRDILSISFYAFGRELASDRGYFSGGGLLLPDGRKGQAWVSGILSHNLVVVVDESHQERTRAGSHLELFAAVPGIEMMEASAFGAYPQTQEYRRICAMIEAPDGHHYVVDFFRVKGGKVHQYAFQSKGKLTGIRPAQASPEPTKLSATWDLWLKNPRFLVPKEPHTFTWRDGLVNLDFMLLNTTDTINRVIITDAPGWRRGASKADLDKPPIQQILVENRGEAPLGTQYAAAADGI